MNVSTFLCDSKADGKESLVGNYNHNAMTFV